MYPWFGFAYVVMVVFCVSLRDTKTGDKSPPPLFLTSSVNGLITLLYYFAIFLCLQSILKILFCLKTDIGFEKNVRSRVLKREWVGDWSFLVTAFHTVDGCVVVVYGYMYQCVCIEKKTFDIRKRKLTPTGENRSYSIL